MPASSSRPPQRAGFALPAVLAVTGVVTLIFLVAITALSNLNAEARSARARVAFLQRALTAEARVSFIAQTEPFGPMGLRIGALRNVNEIAGMTPTESSGLPQADLRLDNRPYRMGVGGDQVVVRLQDQAGMINLARLDNESLSRLMVDAGVAPNEIQGLISRYLDYIDADDQKQVNGAERRDYSLGRPANRPLIIPGEWLSVMGARAAVDARRWRALRPDLAIDYQEIAANVNTATALALQIRYGLSAEQARAAITARETTPLLSLEDLASVSGVSLPFSEGIFAYPSGRIIFTIQDEGSRWVYHGRIAISPGHPDRPFWVDQTELTEQARNPGTETRDVPEFPYPQS